jgi:phosphoribosyl 1,2-cyclic phosphate phosphodiesterase
MVLWYTYNQGGIKTVCRKKSASKYNCFIPCTKVTIFLYFQILELKRYFSYLMNITFLGTGTSQGVPLIACDCEVCRSIDEHDKRLRSSILVQVNGLDLVVDSGPDFRQQMLRVGLQKLDGLIFTHAHKDHIAGLDDIRGFNFRMKTAIDVYCTEQVEHQMHREFHYIFSEVRYPGIPEVAIHRIDKDHPFEVKGFTVQPIEVMHYRLPVLGFRFNDFVYITDANFISEPEKEKIKSCDVLVLNALRKDSHISHFSLEEALHLIAELKPKQAYLTHISHQLGKHAEVQKELPPNVHLAYDGLQLECQ